MPSPGVLTRWATRSAAPLCSHLLSRCGVDAHPHAGLCGHPDWLCLQPGPVSPGRCGLGRAPLAPPAAPGLRALFRLLHLLLVCGARGGQGCPRAAQRAAKDKTSPRSHSTLQHTESEKVKARRSNPAQCLRVTDGRTEAVGGRIYPLPPHPGDIVLQLPPGSPTCLCCCLYPRPQS